MKEGKHRVDIRRCARKAPRQAGIHCPQTREPWEQHRLPCTTCDAATSTWEQTEQTLSWVLKTRASTVSGEQ